MNTVGITSKFYGFEPTNEEVNVYVIDLMKKDIENLQNKMDEIIDLMNEVEHSNSPNKDTLIDSLGHYHASLNKDFKYKQMLYDKFVEMSGISFKKTGDEFSWKQDTV